MSLDALERKGEPLVKLKRGILRVENFYECPGIFLKQADGKLEERNSCKLSASHLVYPSKNKMSKNIILNRLFLNLFIEPGN